MKLQRETLTACGICGTAFTTDERSVRTTDPFGVSDETFTYVQCSHCGTWVQNPRPLIGEMARFYDDDFVLDPSVNVRSRLGRLSLAARSTTLYLSEVKWMLTYMVNGCKYLDCSAGDGQVIKLVQQRRPDVAVHATEFSAPFRTRLAAHIPEDAIRSDIDEFDAETRFDLISAFGVLEHVYSPPDLIASFRARLNPGGKVIVTVPNPESLQHRLSGAKWWCWLAPRHMYMMNMGTLVDLFERTGFKVLEQKHFLLRYSTLPLVLSFLPGLNPLHAHGLKLLAFGLLFYATIPFEWCASLSKRGGFMGLVAVKKD